MTMLEDLLNQVKKFELDEQLKRICDDIQKEETKQNEEIYKEKPQGANIFLCIYVPEQKNDEENFLCLEREFKGIFFVSLWSKSKNVAGNYNRYRTWPIKETTTKNILIKFAEILSFVRGE